MNELWTLGDIKHTHETDILIEICKFINWDFWFFFSSYFLSFSFIQFQFQIDENSIYWDVEVHKQILNDTDKKDRKTEYEQSIIEWIKKKKEPTTTTTKKKIQNDESI